VLAGPTDEFRFERESNVQKERTMTTTNKTLWTGRVLSGIAVAFLIFDASLKVLELAPAAEATAQLGYPTGVVFTLGLIQVACLILYLVPRTAVLGAILWTGYLGGAVATHVRVENPLFSHILFPIYIAAFLWLGLWLRDRRVRGLTLESAPSPV
jgi:hypothetical protein